MSRFFSTKYSQLIPYTPGEQPLDRQYIKLNTNESPFAPSPKAIQAAAEALQQLQLYPDPECHALRKKLASLYQVDPDQVMMTNGSDEVLNFAFMAFCDDTRPAVFADITYGFYKVFAMCNRVPYRELPLAEDFSLNIDDYIAADGTVFIANPNAPSGKAVSVAEVERLLKANPDRVVVVDEAYVDFGAESCVSLVPQYDNLLVTQTFSKSRSMAGARLGFGIGNAALIRDLNTLKYAVNPYTINRATMAAGYGVLEDEPYTRKNCRLIMENRDYTTTALRSLGFDVVDSMTNFVLARHPGVDGKTLYESLKERGILVRHFDTPRLAAYNRITIGSREQMEAFITAVKEIVL